MGTIFDLPIVESAHLVQSLLDLRARGIRCLAAHPSDTGKTLAQADLTGDCCLIFGNEGYGISPEVLAACDETVAIPMPPAVDSLNVATAAAVFGLLFDSLLGATFEPRGSLNNDAVNFLSTAAASAFALGILAILPPIGVR